MTGPGQWSIVQSICFYHAYWPVCLLPPCLLSSVSASTMSTVHSVCCYHVYWPFYLHLPCPLSRLSCLLSSLSVSTMSTVQSTCYYRINWLVYLILPCLLSSLPATIVSSDQSIWFYYMLRRVNDFLPLPTSNYNRLVMPRWDLGLLGVRGGGGLVN